MGSRSGQTVQADHRNVIGNESYIGVRKEEDSGSPKQPTSLRSVAYARIMFHWISLKLTTVLTCNLLHTPS